MKTDSIHFYKIVLYYFIIYCTTGCSTSSKQTFNERSYSHNKPIKVESGKLIASETVGSAETSQRWVGIINSRDGWSDGNTNYSSNYSEKKLYFLDIQDPYLFLMYRQFDRGPLSPTVEDHKQFDLNQGAFLNFHDFNLEVSDVTQNKINGKFVVTFILHDQKSFQNKQKSFAKLQQQEAENNELTQIKEEVHRSYTNTLNAKQFVDHYSNIIPKISSYADAAVEFATAEAAFHSATDNLNQNPKASFKYYQSIKTQMRNPEQYFTTLKQALESWAAMNEAFNDANRQRFGKSYLKMAYDLKNQGEHALQVNDFALASQNFMQAQEEISHVGQYSQSLGR